MSKGLFMLKWPLGSASTASAGPDAVWLVSMKFLLKTLLALGIGLATAALL